MLLLRQIFKLIKKISCMSLYTSEDCNIQEHGDSNILIVTFLTVKRDGNESFPSVCQLVY